MPGAKTGAEDGLGLILGQNLGLGLYLNFNLRLKFGAGAKSRTEYVIWAWGQN